MRDMAFWGSEGPRFERFMLLFVLAPFLLIEFNEHINGWTIFASADEIGGDIAGHLQPLGSHRPAEGSIDVVHGFIQPRKFYKEYVEPGKPILFKGAAKVLHAFKHWNDAHLNEKYGKLLVQAETKKKEDRLQDVHVLTMSEFLQAYKENEIYMVHDVPAEMDEEVGLPKPLLCGGFQEVLQTAIIWFSNGGTRSVLHSDDVDNINCLLDGEKDLFMIDKVFKEDIQEDGFVLEGGYSKVDVDAVDFEKFPRLKNLPWWEGRMEKGDCLFIPIGWYHQVNSRGRNLAVNLWFQHLLWFNETDCDAYAADLQHEFISLSRYELYGPNSEEAIRFHLFKSFKGLKEIKPEDIAEKLGYGLTDVEVPEFVAMFDTNRDFVISWEEVYLGAAADVLDAFPNLLPGFLENEENYEEDNKDNYPYEPEQYIHEQYIHAPDEL